MNTTRYRFVARGVAALCSGAVLIGLSACAANSPPSSTPMPTSSESAEPDSSATPTESSDASDSFALCSEEQLLTMSGEYGSPPTDVSPTFDPAEILADLPVVCVASSVSDTSGPMSSAVLEGGQTTIDALAVNLESIGMASNLNENAAGDDQRGAQVLPLASVTDAKGGFDNVEDLVWVEVTELLDESGLGDG